MSTPTIVVSLSVACVSIFVIVVAVAIFRKKVEEADAVRALQRWENDAAIAASEKEQTRIKLQYDSFVSRLEEPDCKLLDWVVMSKANADKLNDEPTYSKLVAWYKKCRKPADPIPGWTKGKDYDSYIASVDGMKPPFTRAACDSHVYKIYDKDEKGKNDMLMAKRDRYAEDGAIWAACSLLPEPTTSRPEVRLSVVR